MNKFTINYATEGKHWNIDDALNDENGNIRNVAKERLSK
jgi:hypothetical protein